MDLGTLLHFEDHGLKETYFLDPQWLAKLMASVIHPAAQEGKSPIKKGEVIHIKFAWKPCQVHTSVYVQWNLKGVLSFGERRPLFGG